MSTTQSVGRPPLFLVTVNKMGHTSEYSRDVMTLLALPRGAIFRFRYRLRYLDRALGILGGVAAREGRSSFFLSDNEIEGLQRALSERIAWTVLFDEQSARYIPVRKVRTGRVEVKGGFVRIVFKVGPFVEYGRDPGNTDSDSYHQLIQNVRVDSTENVAGQPYDPGGHALVLVGQELPDRFTDSADDWQQVVRQLRNLPNYAAWPYVAVSRIYGSVIPETTVGIDDDGAYPLDSDSSYVLELQHSRPSDTTLPPSAGGLAESRSSEDAKRTSATDTTASPEPPKPPAVRVNTYSEHIVPLHSEVKLHGPYDLSLVRFIVKKRLSDVRSYIGVRSDDAGLPEFELPVKIRTRWDAFDWMALVTMVFAILTNVVLLAVVLDEGLAKDSVIAFGVLITVTVSLLQRFTPKERG